MQRAEGPAMAVLDRLAEAGALEAREERRGRVYELVPALRRALDGGDGPDAPAGASREDVILQYVDRHGRITRSQAAELCGVEGREARGVLEKLVKRGDLVVRGERRGSYYERSTEDGAAAEVEMAGGEVMTEDMEDGHNL
jgi:ATP-dependent DNA helicase RecG